MAELIEQYAAQGKKNLWGETIKVIQAQSELGAVGTCHGALVNGALASSFTCSQGLLLMISNLYHIAGEHLPFVLHIANRTVGMAATSLATDHTDLYAIEGCNMCVLQSSNVQECYDMTVVAHAAAIKNRTAFVHSFEGYRVSHQLESLTLMKDEDLMKFVDMQALMEFRNRAVVSTDRPYAQNVGLGGEVHMQMLEASKFDFDKVPASVEKYFDLMFEITGRRYHVYEYSGAKDAETVIVILGAAGSTAQLVTEEMAKEGKKVGVLRLRLFRPFDCKLFCEALPKTVKSVVCLDRAPELVQAGGLIYRDVMVAMMKENRLAGVKVCGGRYAYAGFELLPKHILSIYNTFYQTPQESQPTEFVVGIVDDLRNKSLKAPTVESVVALENKLLPTQVNQSLLYGIGSDGTIGAARNAVQILQNTASNIQVQCQFQFDGKKSGGLTVSHIRLYKGDDQDYKRRISLAEYDITNAQYIAVHAEHYLMKYKNVFENLQENGTVVLNVDCKGDLAEYAEKNLPSQIKKDIARKHANLYMINANQVATAVGLPGRTNNILILFYFKFGMTGLIKFEDAVMDMKIAA
jgi:pyruvate-ferredoxin/flavodoxin oxidoreductase